MTPRTLLAEEYGAIHADDIMATLKRGGWIVVRKDAIKLAQAHARETNDDNKVWNCPINYDGCTQNCGSYSCGN